jgi:chromosome segregation ATPase
VQSDQTGDGIEQNHPRSKNGSRKKMKKTQRETTLEIETLGKKSRNIDESISNRIQEMEERISGAEDSIGNMDTTIKENANCKNILTQNIQKIQDKMRRPNLWIIGVDDNEDFST